MDIIHEIIYTTWEMLLLACMREYSVLSILHARIHTVLVTSPPADWEILAWRSTHELLAALGFLSSLCKRASVVEGDGFVSSFQISLTSLSIGSPTQVGITWRLCKNTKEQVLVHFTELGPRVLSQLLGWSRPRSGSKNHCSTVGFLTRDSLETWGQTLLGCGDWLEPFRMSTSRPGLKTLDASNNLPRCNHHNSMQTSHRVPWEEKNHTQLRTAGLQAELPSMYWIPGVMEYTSGLHSPTSPRAPGGSVPLNQSSQVLPSPWSWQLWIADKKKIWVSSDLDTFRLTQLNDSNMTLWLEFNVEAIC